MNPYDVYSLYDITPVKGEGFWVYDNRGNKYLDFYGGHAVISVGHSHPHYIKRISSQLENLGFYSNAVVNPLQHELCSKLAGFTSVPNFDLFLVNSGAEANENALKLASFYNKRKKVYAFENGFHGRTSAAINVTHAGRKYRSALNDGIEVVYGGLSNVDKLAIELKRGDICCVIIEAVQGVGGLDSVPIELLGKARELCDKTDTVLILDEIQCGFGRTGDFFAFEQSGIKPDIITMAKGMGNGFPVGGVLINTEKLPPSKGRLGTTFGGNHLACAASLAVLEIMDKENLLVNIREMGSYLADLLTDIDGVKKVKGRGLMLGVEFEFDIAELRSVLLHDFFTFTGNSTNPRLLRILPPYIIDKDIIDQFVSRLTEAVGRILT